MQWDKRSQIAAISIAHDRSIPALHPDFESQIFFFLFDHDNRSRIGDRLAGLAIFQLATIPYGLSLSSVQVKIGQPYIRIHE